MGASTICATGGTDASQGKADPGGNETAAGVQREAEGEDLAQGKSPVQASVAKAVILEMNERYRAVRLAPWRSGAWVMEKSQPEMVEYIA